MLAPEIAEKFRDAPVATMEAAFDQRTTLEVVPVYDEETGESVVSITLDVPWGGVQVDLTAAQAMDLSTVLDAAATFVGTANMLSLGIDQAQGTEAPLFSVKEAVPA